MVEGESDRRALSAILPVLSEKIGAAVRSNSLAFESLHGATNLTYKLSQLRDQLCTTHSFLDNDESARLAVSKAESEALLDASGRGFAMSPGMKDSELEDLYDFKLYAEMIKRRYNVDLLSYSSFKARRRKWTDRIQSAFAAGGQNWDESVCKQVKTQVADLVVADPGNAVFGAWASSLSSLVLALESKLDEV